MLGGIFPSNNILDLIFFVFVFIVEFAEITSTSVYLIFLNNKRIFPLKTRTRIIIPSSQDDLLNALIKCEVEIATGANIQDKDTEYSIQKSFN